MSLLTRCASITGSENTQREREKERKGENVSQKPNEIIQTNITNNLKRHIDHLHYYTSIIYREGITKNVITDDTVFTRTTNK